MTARVVEQVEIIIRNESMLVRVPQHVHTLLLSGIIRARITNGKTLNVDIRCVIQNLFCKCWTVPVFECSRVFECQVIMKG